MKAKILETFQSIQGEGIYSGVKQIFVRFFECNMHCTWCDTPHSIGDTTRHYDEYSVSDLMATIDSFDSDCHSVSLTGGEPMIQSEFIKKVLPLIKERGFKTYLDTNGIYHKELESIINDIDIIAMDIKLPSSTKCQDYWEDHSKFLDVAQQREVFIKAVVSSDTDEEDIKKAVEIVKAVDKNIVFIIQPNSFELNNGVMKRCTDFHNYALNHLTNARIMSQMHRQMKIR